MKQTILIESVRGETRLAILEEGRLCEYYAERPGADEVTGSIYLGRVDNVVPGMNAAFVDIGLEKNGFLYAGDIPEIARGDRQLAARMEGHRLERLVRPGQEILVQVTKVQSGQKGHRLSCHVTLPGRTMVLLPGVRYAGVSRKITDAAERDRLHAAARSFQGESDMGLIVRTAAAGQQEEALRGEWESLTTLWGDIRSRAARAKAPAKVFSNDDLALRCVRDLLGPETEAVWVDDPDTLAAVRRQAEIMAPQWIDRIRINEAQTPLFDLYRVDRQLDKALRKYVWLDSGGSLVIEETEAMTVIDVNTGKFTGKRDLEDTIYRINCEAAREIVRQLRLRDIGGIVIVDFIDMADATKNEALLGLLRELAGSDRNRLSVVGMTGLGLVELTRKKQRRPQSRQQQHTCSACGGDGAVPSHETTARRAVREIWRRRRMGEENPILAEAEEPVVRWMRRIGAPEGGRVYACPRDGLEAGQYRLSPTDESSLPEKSKPLK